MTRHQSFIHGTSNTGFESYNGSNNQKYISPSQRITHVKDEFIPEIQNQQNNSQRISVNEVQNQQDDSIDTHHQNYCFCCNYTYCKENKDLLSVTTNHLNLRVKRLSPKAKIPRRSSVKAAGYDLYSASNITIPAKGKALVPTDIVVVVPEGTYGRVAPRSGLALRNSIDCGGGVVDADYRGPVGVILFNHGEVDYQVNEGDRVAQLVLERICTPDVVEIEELDETERDNRGFGSTGLQ